MTLNRVRSSLYFFALALGLAIQSIALAAEETVLDAYATWEGRGQFFQVGIDTAVFVGSFGGALYVDEKKKLVQGGHLVCPGVVEIDFKSGKHSGNGRCVIGNEEGERIYALWNCAGKLGEGCSGRLTLTEGTGKWEGVKGSGSFTSQSDLHTLAEIPGNVVGRTVRGIMVWRDFRYTLP